MVILKTPQEIERIRVACKAVAEVLRELQEEIRPGVRTLDLDRKAEKQLRQKGMKPAFLGYRGYPRTLCASVNEEVVHGIPSKRELREGDIVGLDLGAICEGYYGDAAVTVSVGKVSERAQRLMKITEESLYKGIEKAVVGGRLSDISAAVQKHVEEQGYSVVRDFVGHGIGRSLHEDPQIPNHGVPGKGIRLEVGLVLAIEPMINEGTHEVEILEDGWTAVTRDRKLSAHYEHTIAIANEGPIILSRLD
ncbi:MAG: type I methionyl aminopeptidase [Deltaproteobacteria bacterium]|nr:type I methionyl aminopeptidase [Deltaproteobacteria bacterium]